MTCDDFQAHYLAQHGGADADSHLAGCNWCRSGIEELDAIRLQLGATAMWEAPSDDLEEAIVASLRRTRRPIAPTNRAWIAAAVATLVVVFAGAFVLIQSRQPDWDIALPASPGIPATASVAGWNTPAGTRMVFLIDGLKPAGENEYYEIWLTAADGRHVSAGTFTGPGRIESFAGVSRRDFPRIWITLEPNDGDEGIGGPTVLDTGS